MNEPETYFDTPTPLYGYVDLYDDAPEEPKPRWWRNEPYVSPQQGLLVIIFGSELVSHLMVRGSLLAGLL